MSQENLYVLCVDDDIEFFGIFEDYFSGTEFSVLKSQSADEARKILEEHAPDIAMIFSDIQMPVEDGLTFRSSIKDIYPNIPFAIFSGYVTREIALQGIELKIAAFLEKPVSEELLLELVKKEARVRVEEIRDERELLAGFLEESAGLTEELEGLILSLESAPNDLETLNRIFGILHTIKGTSGFFKPDTVSKFAHKYEDFLSKAKNGEFPVTPEVVSIFLKALDTLNTLIEALKMRTLNNFQLTDLISIFQYDPAAGGSQVVEGDGGASASSSPASESKTKDWVRAPLAILDTFMRKSGEITVLRNMVNKVVQSIERNYGSDENVKVLGDLLEEMHGLNSIMQNNVMELRKVGLKEVYRPITRVVRDLSSSLSKEIDLKLGGENLRVDTAISEVLNSSLIHMIRNCMDHGIECPEEREKFGKARKGVIKLLCSEVRENVIFEIIDDGRGIDPKRIKSKLLEKGMYTEEEIDAMAPRELNGKIFEPGFSTAEVVTDVSGRGVGMDQVKASVEKLGGSITVDSTLGHGTHITLLLPVPKSVQIITSLCLGWEVSRSLCLATLSREFSF